MMRSRDSRKTPNNGWEVQQYRAPEIEWQPIRCHQTCKNYNLYLVPVIAGPKPPEYTSILHTPVIINDQRLRQRPTSPPAYDETTRSNIIPITTPEPTPGTTAEPSWRCIHIRDPQLIHHPEVFRLLPDLPKPSESGGPNPTSFHFYFSSHKPRKATDSVFDKVHELICPMSQTQSDTPATIQKWPRVTNLNQIHSPTTTYQTHTCHQHKRQRNLTPTRFPSPRPITPKPNLTNFDQILIYPDQNEVF